MQEEPKRYQCRHIFTDGRRCGSPSLRHEELCYYHHTTRRPVEKPRTREPHFDLPLPEDRSAIQSAIGQVLQRIARNEIDPKRAGLLLYGLQIASLNLPREAAPTPKSSRAAEPDLVEEVIADPIYGPLAPRAELGQTKHQSVIQALLENLRDDPPEAPEAWSETEEPGKATEPGTPCPASEDMGEQPQTTNPTPEILPQIQACATHRYRRANRPGRDRKLLHRRHEPIVLPSASPWPRTSSPCGPACPN